VKRTTILLLGLGLIVLAVAGRPGMDERAPMDSARSVPPKRRLEWMHERGIEMPGSAGMPESDSGLTLVGKWGRGPAAEDTGKDTLVVLTLGSEVALLSFAEPDSPRVLSEIQFPSLTAQSCLVDSLLYASSNADLEVWNVSDPTLPVKRGELLGAVGDFWIRDTFLYYIRRDTFHVISIASPANLYQLGSCVESGSVTTGSGNTVVVCQSGGFAFVDVSNPAGPHQVGTYPCGHALSATARGNLVCASYEETGYPYPTRFITLDISNPSSPRLLAKLNDLGGYDIFLDGPLAFVSGRGPGVENPQPFQILGIADSAHPAFIDSCRTTNRYPYGVWENSSLNRALVADEYDGLAIVDISNLNNALLDTWMLNTGPSWDVHVDDQRCYVASPGSGMRLLDVSDPARPTCSSGLDSAFVDEANYAVTARDSFAFMGWSPNPYFRTVSVTDPLKPEIVAGCSLGNPPQAVVLCDSFAYVAINFGFLVINVARPRAPAVVGACDLPDYSYGMCLQDTLAYVTNFPLAIINIANPAQPETVGSIPYASGVFVKDTLAYGGSTFLQAPSFKVWNVANPESPVFVDSIAFGALVYSTVVVDSLAYVGCRDGLRLVNVSDPHNMRVIARHGLPDIGWRLVYDSPYVYVATMDAGVCILETTAVGIAEAPVLPDRTRGFRVAPSPVRDWVDVIFASPLAEPCRLALIDVAGREVASVRLVPGLTQERRTRISLRGLAPGLYFLRAGGEGQSGVRKIVKR
jgi:hypothetical protein